MRLLYFTESYPFGLGEEWKKNELAVLREYYSTIDVIPFHYGSSKEQVEYSDHIVTFHPPLFEDHPEPNWFGLIKLMFLSPIIIFSELLVAAQKGIGALSSFKKSCSTISALNGNSKLIKLLDEDFDLAYFFWGRLSVELMALRSISNPFVVRLHGYDLFQERHVSHYIPFQKFILNRSRMILAISCQGKQYMERVWSIPESKIFISRLGTISKGRSVMEQTKNLSIVSCSWMVPVKRLDRIIDVLLEITEFPITWTHIGDGPLMEEIRIRATQLGENVKCNFLGKVAAPDVQECLINSKSDIFINCSDSEGVPVSIMEAMAVGLPVIATDVGGVHEIVNEGNGYLVSNKDSVHNILDALHDFINLSQEAREEMSSNAFDTYKSKYNAHNNAHVLGRKLHSIS